jgi:hypothetical protein
MLFDNNLNLIQRSNFTNFVVKSGDHSLSYEIILENLDTNLKICILDPIDLNECDFDKINQSVDLAYINVGRHQCYLNFPLPKLTIPYIVLINEYQITKSNHIYFPYWLMASRLFAEDDVLIRSEKYKISCVNRNPRYERIYNYDLLKQLPFADEIYFSLSIPPMDNIDEQISVKSIIMVGYQDTMLNIITETYHNTGLLSEKTFKPIRAEQLFLMCGPAGAIAHLRKLGFDTFDDFIDHEYYDYESDWKSRISKMHKILIDIYDNIENIYNQTIDRRKNNRQHLCSDVLKNLVIDPILHNIR